MENFVPPKCGEISVGAQMNDAKEVTTAVYCEDRAVQGALTGRVRRELRGGGGYTRGDGGQRGTVTGPSTISAPWHPYSPWS